MPNNLPLNWCECKLEDLGSFFGGYAFKSSNYSSNGARVVRITNVQKGYFDDESPKFYNIQESLNDFLLQNDDILISLTGNVGRVCKIEQKYLPAYLNQRVEAFRIGDKICSKFVYYFMQQQDFEKKCIENSKGVAQKNMSPEYIKKYLILLPPLAEQERIVEKIEALFAGIDEGVERLKSAQAQIKQYRQSVLKSAFEGKLYKTTEWKEVKLKDVCTSITDGDHQAPPKAIKGIPFIMISDIRDHKINLYTNNFVKEDYYNNISENRKAHKGDILYSVVGSYGIATLVNITDKFCFQRHIALIKVNIKNITSPFLYHLMNSNNIYKQATICSTGTAQKTVPLSGLRNFSFFLPTLPEQQRIVEEIEKRFLVADELEKAVNEGLEKADKLKQSILKKAFEGKLAPQNPNDEPASALLERIKKSQPPTKGKKK